MTLSRQTDNESADNLDSQTERDAMLTIDQAANHSDRSTEFTSAERMPAWPDRPPAFGMLLTPVEAAQYLRLDETGTHTPESAVRTLNYWRDRGVLKATKFARHIWYRKVELDRFLEAKTER